MGDFLITTEEHDHGYPDLDTGSEAGDCFC